MIYLYVPLGLVLLVLLFPSPFAQLIWRARVTWPVQPMAGVELRAATRWMRIFGRTRTAMTLGNTVLISLTHWATATPEVRAERIRHELVHVTQARRLGPLYLPWFLILYVRHGYRNHPMEREARGETQA